MYCAGNIVTSRNLTFCLAASYSYLSPVNQLYIENKAETPGFYCATNNGAI